MSTFISFLAYVFNNIVMYHLFNDGKCFIMNKLHVSKPHHPLHSKLSHIHILKSTVVFNTTIGSGALAIFHLPLLRLHSLTPPLR